MKRLLFTCLLLCSATLVSQQESSVLINKNTFSSRDGYVISNPYHSIYDTHDWLWVLGEHKFSNEYIFGDKEIIMQRFDGANFFNVPLPDIVGKKIKEGHFFKHKEKGLYLKLYYVVARAELFFIDTETLKITAVEDYNHLKEKYIISEEYDFADETRLIITSKEIFYSATLDGPHLQFLDSIPLARSVKDPFLADIRTTRDHVFVKLLFQQDGIHLNKQGKIIKKIASTDFVDSEGNTFYPNKIHNAFVSNDGYYFYFDDYENVFKFDAENLRFVEVPDTSEDYALKKDMEFDDGFQHAFSKEVISDYSEFRFYSLNGFSPQLTAKIEIKNYTETTYNQFGKDLVVLSGNTLDSYSFINSKIKTFLKGKSIRTIKKLSTNKYIVATDAEGIYMVDTKDDTEEKLKIISNGKEIAINYSRDIFVNEDNTITINDLDNLYTLDKNFEVIKNKSITIRGEEIIKIEDTIFSAYQMGVISKFSINENTYTTIPNTENIQVRELATDGTTLFATTRFNGIFEYKNGHFDTYAFENEESENLLSINYIEDYGILVSTKFGKVYTYDTDTKSLKLFYEDDLNASIVGMVADDNKNLWLNTYAGIVYFNPSEQKVVRYTSKDGVYEMEGNRYSTYKDPDGNIWIGSYNGLSYFNPNELSTKEIEAQPKFTSMSFFDAEKNRWKVQSSPRFLDSLKTINLPSEYQRFSATMSMFGQIDPRTINYRYRLLVDEIDSEWFTSYSGKEILFANLAAGKYTLQVEALSASKKKIGKTIELNVISEKVFYKTWWFISLLMLAVFCVATYLFYQYKGKQKLFAKNKIALNESKIKTEMMLEIHHRIKNNLQIISGLLGLQMLNSSSEELKWKLQDSQSRIESIAGIHDILYNSNNFESISFKEHVASCITYYKTLFPVKVIYHLDIATAILPMDMATPLSLLLNELINNSNKHAFAHTEHPEIAIVFKKNDTKYILEYSDNGAFEKKDIQNESMGLKIVEMMNKQLEGQLKIEEVKGFKCTVIF